MTDIASTDVLHQLAVAARSLGEAADSAAESLSAPQAEQEDDIAVATLVAERKRTLCDGDLVDFDDMAARVGVGLDDLP